MECVLITGGTGGIGYELARIFARNSRKVVLVSSSGERLNAAKEKLEREFSADVAVYEQDLSRLGAAEELYSRIKADGIAVDILINNAGYGLVGNTEDIPMRQDESMMVLNMISPVALCKLFLPEMYGRGRGKILNVASTGAFQPGPYTSTYFASKSFLLSYSRAVRFEAKKRGVAVCAVCPGATRTNFFTREGVETPGYAMPADVIAAKIYGQLTRNKAVSIPGLRNKLMNLFPSSIKMAVIAKVKG